MAAESKSEAAGEDQLQTFAVSSVLSADHPVISIYYCDDRLLAGTDDGLVILWHGENLQFNKPLTSLNLDIADSVNAIRYLHKDVWLVGCGEQLVFLKLTSNVLAITHTIQFDEEVNSIDVNEKTTYAAVADDTGCLSIIDLKTRKIHKKLLGHENICSCVRFRPKSPWSLVTGGLDCKLILWDFKKGQALGSSNMSDIATKGSEEEKGSYVVNPPLIHCLDISADGLVAAAGLENGKVLLFTIGGKGFKLVSTIDAHSRGVSGICIGGDMTLTSTANDSKIIIWNLSTARAPGKTLVWATQLHSSLHTGKPSAIIALPQSKKLIVADETTKIIIYEFT